MAVCLGMVCDEVIGLIFDYKDIIANFQRTCQRINNENRKNHKKQKNLIIGRYNRLFKAILLPKNTTV